MVPVCWPARGKTRTSGACRGFRPRPRTGSAADPAGTAVGGAPDDTAEDEPAVAGVAEADQRRVRRTGRRDQRGPRAPPAVPVVGGPGQRDDGPACLPGVQTPCEAGPVAEQLQVTRV